jgi:hypothetical protein
LNPIEECWSKIKGEVRKTPFGKYEILADKIEEAAQKTTAKDNQGWICNNSQKFSLKCLNMERIRLSLFQIYHA